jgi:pyruvate/2-oxoglutarate dehydrogenase complex dihydrolipoamide acyltransferase (E2) component
MGFKCPKCESENVNVTANKRGALVGKCADCKKWGNYGNQESNETGSAKGEETGAPRVQKAATKTSRKPAGADRRGGGARPAKPAARKPAESTGRDNGTIHRSGQSGGVFPALSKFLGWLDS